MQHAPFLHVRQCSFWQLAIKLTRQDVHSCLKLAIDCMKMRRPVIPVVHGDYDTKKSTQFRHLINCSAEARRFRLTINYLTNPAHIASIRPTLRTPAIVIQRPPATHFRRHHYPKKQQCGSRSISSTSTVRSRLSANGSYASHLSDARCQNSLHLPALRLNFSFATPCSIHFVASSHTVRTSTI